MKSEFTINLDANWLRSKDKIAPLRSFKKLKWYNWLGFYWFYDLLRVKMTLVNNG